MSSRKVFCSMVIAGAVSAVGSQVKADTTLVADSFNSYAVNSTPAANGYSTIVSGASMNGAFKTTPSVSGNGLVVAAINTAATTNYGYWWKDEIIPNMGATAEPIALADVQMLRSGSTVTGRRDSFDGLEAFGTDASGNPVEIGGVGVYGSSAGYQLAFIADGRSTATGDPDLVYYVTTGTAYVPSSTVFTELQIQCDFTTQTFSVFWNGTGFANIPFISVTGNAAATGLTDIDMSSDLHRNETLAFDNYIIETLAPVPEPTSLGLVSIGAMGLLGRRRRA